LASLLLAAYALAYVSWIPPHAVLTQAYPINATHFTAYVNYTTVYIAQAGLSFRGPPAEAQAVMQYLYSQCRYVAVDVLERRADLSRRTALDRRRLLLQRRLHVALAEVAPPPLRRLQRLRGVRQRHQRHSSDAGGHLHKPHTGRMVPRPLDKGRLQVPETNLTLLRYAASLSEQLKALKAELERSRADASQLVAKLEAQLAALEAQRRALEEALRQRESEVAALQANLRAAQAENERLKSQLAQLKAENDQLKAKLASMNQTLAGLNNQLTSLKAQLAVQTSGGEEGPNPLMYVLPAALAGVIAALVIYRRRRQRSRRAIQRFCFQGFSPRLFFLVHGGLHSGGGLRNRPRGSVRNGGSNAQAVPTVENSRGADSAQKTRRL
jgi:hypothetical protein